jgi:hypothetical protein
MHIRNTKLLSLVKIYFGAGSIFTNLKQNSVEYRITKFEEN